MSRATLDPAMLHSPFAYGAFTLSGRSFQDRSARIALAMPQSEPHGARTMVWALPRSLAATCGIILIFSSSGYLDVSVHRVPPAYLCIQYTVTGSLLPGFPIQISPDHCLFAAPRSFSQLTTSFIGSQCQGIRPAPL